MERTTQILGEDFEQKIATIMQQMKIPGLSIAVTKEQEIIYAKGFGCRNLERNLSASSDTIYGIGSCAKAVTCLAILMLHEQGKLSIDDPISKHIPVKLGSEEDPVRIKHLMSHSSGIPSLGFAEILIFRLAAPQEEKWVPFSSKNDFYLHINGAKSEIVDIPEKRYFYFNGGYAMLGEIIEAVTNMEYEDFIKEEILKPLKMNTATFVREEYEKIEDRMTPYFVQEGKPVKTEHTFDPYIYPGGGLICSVKEFSNFLIMLNNQGTFKDKQLVKPESIKKMFSISIKRPEGFFGETGYGFGIVLHHDFLGTKLCAHGGSTGLSSANFAIIPELKIGVVTEANVGSHMGGPICQTVLAMLMEKNPEEEIPIIQIQEKMNTLAGNYETYKGINKVSIVLREGLLYVESEVLGMKRSTPLIPLDDKLESNEFYIYSMGNKTPVTFEIKENGKINLFIERNYYHKAK